MFHYENWGMGERATVLQDKITLNDGFILPGKLSDFNNKVSFV